MNAESVIRLKRRATRVYIYIMLMVYPLFTGFAGYTDITGSKLAFYLTVTALWLGLLLVLSIKSRTFVTERLSAIEVCLLAFLAFCVISALFSPFGTAVIIGKGRFDGLMSTILSICIFFSITKYAEPENGFVYALAISMSLCCAVAVLQLLGGNPLGLFPGFFTYYGMGIQYSGEFLGTIGNANLFSAFLVLCLPFLSGFLIIGARQRYFLLLPITLGGFCLFECTVSAGKLALAVFAFVSAPILVSDTERLRRFLRVFAVFLMSLAFSEGFYGTRSGVFSLGFSLTGVAIGLLLVAAFIGCCSFIKTPIQISASLLRICLVAASLILTAAAFWYIYALGARGEGTVYEISSVLRGETEDSFGSSRIMIWRDCLELFTRRPLLGGGPGTLPLRLDISFSRFVEETGQTLQSRVDNAHNVYLGILTDTGIPALAAYLAAMALTLINALRQKCGSSGKYALILCCGLLCYWIQDFFGLGLFIVSPLMWILWGLAAGATRPVCDKTEPVQSNT